MFRLTPVSDRNQEVLEHSLEISVPSSRREYEDIFGNWTTSVEVESPFDELRVVSHSLVRLHGLNREALELPNRRTSIPLVWMPWQRQMMSPYLLPVELPENQLLEFSISPWPQWNVATSTGGHVDRPQSADQARF